MKVISDRNTSAMFFNVAVSPNVFISVSPLPKRETRPNTPFWNRGHESSIVHILLVGVFPDPRP